MSIDTLGKSSGKTVGVLYRLGCHSGLIIKQKDRKRDRENILQNTCGNKTQRSNLTVEQIRAKSNIISIYCCF